MQLADLFKMYNLENYYILWYGYKCTNDYFDNDELIKDYIEIVKRGKNCLDKTIFVFESTSVYTGKLVGTYKFTNIEEKNNYYVCNYEKVSTSIDELINRLVIRSDKQSTFYYPTANRFIVDEIKPKKGSRNVREFTNYAEFDLTYKELKEVVDFRYNDYVKPLSCVNGIYMIIDQKTGKQYIGKASGKEGLFSRFKDYVNTGHGNDLDLMNLLAKDSTYCYNFKFIILEVLSVTLSEKEVLARESFYKERFLSRIHGLNKN